MAQSIFSLFGEVFVNTDKADESLKKTEEKAGSTADKLGKGIATAAKWGTAIVGGATVAAGALINVAEKTTQQADEIDKASIRMGIGAESYQELAYAAGQCGVDMSTMEKAAKALEGTDLNMDDAMQQIMSLSTEEERAAKAAELFGEATAYKMAPLLKQSGEDFDGLKQRANDLGLVLSQDTVNAGVKLGDTMSDVKQSFEMLGTQLGATLMPVVQDFVDLIIEMLPTFQDIAKDIAPLLQEVLEAILPTLMDLAKTLLPVVVDLIEKLLPPITEVVESLLPVIVQLIEALAPILEVLLEVLTPILELVIELLSPIIDLIGEAITPLIQILGELIKEVLEPLMPIIEVLAKMLIDSLGNAFDNLKPIIEDVKDYFTGLIDFITGVFSGDWNKAWSGIVEMFGAIFEGIVDLIKYPINTVIDKINSVFSDIGSISIPDWVPGIGGETISLPQIKRLAEGGTISSSGLAIVGEAGAELLEMPTGARVTPLGANGKFEQKMDRLLDLLERYMPEMATKSSFSNLELSVNKREFARLVNEVS